MSDTPLVLSLSLSLSDDDGGCYNSKNWTKYIQSIFFKYTGVGGVSIHALRSSFVTIASNESTEAMMESIAVAMRHSR